jgi:hypothetical protein
MNSLNIRVFLGVILTAVAIFATTGSYSQSMVSTTTTGDLCKVKNPAGRNVRRDFGGLANINSSGNYNVACPITTFLDANYYHLIVSFENFHENGKTQNYKCSLTEYDLDNFRVRSHNRSLAIASGDVDGLLFEFIQMSEITNRLHLICTLPPRSFIGTIGIDSEYP